MEGAESPRLQTALRQFGRDEEAELCEAAARQGCGERNDKKNARAPSKGAVALTETITGVTWSPASSKSRPSKRCLS